MQILNASKYCLNLRLDNGLPLTVKTGELSVPFIGSVSMLSQIIATSKPSEVAIIVGSSYELDLLRKMNASIAYLCNSEAEARAKLFNSKDGKAPVETTPPQDNVEVFKLREQNKNLQEELKVAAVKVEELTAKLNEAPSEIVLKELEARNKSLSEVESEREKLSEELRLLTEDHEMLKANLNQVTTERDNAINEVSELSSKVAAFEQFKVQDTPEYKELEQKVAELTNMMNEAASKPEVDESKAQEIEAARLELVEANQRLTDEKAQYELELNQTKSEVEQLKSDADKMVAEYTAMKDKVSTARSTLQAVMQQFNIEYDAETNTFTMK